MDTTVFTLLAFLPPKWLLKFTSSWFFRREQQKEKREEKKEKAEISKREQGRAISHHCSSACVPITFLSLDGWTPLFPSQGTAHSSPSRTQTLPPPPCHLGWNAVHPVHPPGSRIHLCRGISQDTRVQCLLTTFILLIYSYSLRDKCRAWCGCCNKHLQKRERQRGREGGRQGRSKRRKEVGRKRKESKPFLLFQVMLNLTATC